MNKKLSRHYKATVAQQWYHGEQVLTELKRRLEILS